MRLLWKKFKEAKPWDTKHLDADLELYDIECIISEIDMKEEDAATLLKIKVHEALRNLANRTRAIEKYLGGE